MGEDVKKIAIYPGYSDLLKDQMFDLNSNAGKQLRGLPLFEKHIALKEFLLQKGIELHTYDMYKNLRDIDVWIMFEVSPLRYLFLIKNFIHPKKVIPMLFEPAVVLPWQWKYVKYWSLLHKVVLTWSPELVKTYKKFSRFHTLPFFFDKKRCEVLRDQAKKDKGVLIQSNKASRVKGELYSLRRKIVRYFEAKDPDFFDLFGYGWNTPNTRHLGPSEPFYTSVYKGEAGDKWEVFAKYKFIFCIQNTIQAGDFEVDAFMAMAVGSVPIYLPPPDADEFIPQNTYIDYNKFKDLDTLYEYLKKISKEEYENYRKAGWEYLNSPKFKTFTPEQYCEDLYAAIIKYAKK